MQVTLIAKHRVLAILAGTLLVVPLARGAVFSTVPSYKIGTASLISTSAADTFYGSGTTSTNSTGAVGRPNEVVELARALGGNVDSIYAYVRNSVDMAWMYGLQKGPVGTIMDRSGTAFDQAQLMVELLRQSGYTATYLAGTITLTGTQFNTWSGITNATAACQLLSSGGIPAQVNGSTSATCSYGSAAVTSVVLGHVWVRVNISGTNYVFDPAYKPHTFKAGVNLATAAGLTAGEPLTQASTGMTSGTASTVPYVRSLNAGLLNTKLQTYGTNLLTYIQTNYPAGEIEDIVGGSEIVADPTASLRQTSLPYTSTTQRTWTGNIPDQYRTSLRVQIAKWQPVGTVPPVIIDKLLYSDEIYGRKLIFNTNFENSGFLGELKLLDDAGVGPVLGSYSGSENPNFSIGGEITLTANHPYSGAADGSSSTNGTYMDVVVKKVSLRYWTPLTIVHGWGDISRGLVDKHGTRNDRELVPTPVTCAGEFSCESVFVASAGDGRREQIAASWLAQFSQSARLHAAIAKSVFAHHHSLGLVAADTYMNTTPVGGDPPTITMLTITDSFDRVDLEAGYSVTSKTNVAADRRAAVLAIAATGEALEGSVVGQIADMPDTASTASRFEWGNAPPVAEDPSAGAGARRFYQFTSANSAQATNVVTLEGGTSAGNNGIHTGTEQPEIGPSETSARRSAVITAVGTYANAGFTVTAAEEAFLGPGQRGGTYLKQATNAYIHVWTKQRGGALVATRLSGSDPIEIAHVLIGDDVNAKGGGGGVQPSHDSQYNPSKAADILKSRFVDRSTALGVDMKTGKASAVSPASISVGNDGFPYQLDANFIWRGGEPPAEGFGPMLHTTPQVPWTTNWHNVLNISSSGLEAMYEGDVRATAGTIAAFLAAQDTYKQTASNQRDVAGILVNSWWLRQLQGNVVTATVGASSRQFVRLVDGQWLAPGADSYAKLTQTGSRVPFTEQLCDQTTGVSYVTSRGWDHAGMSFKVTNANGDEQNFGFWKTLYREGGVGTICSFQHGFRLNSWVFPQGVTVNVVYANDSFGMPQLSEVNNSLGRKIRFTNSGLSGFDNGLSGLDARAVTIGDVLTDGSNPSRPVYTSTHTDPDSKVTKFLYSRFGREYVLEKILTADNSTVPSLQYDYDSLRRVKEARDAVALRVGGRNPYQFFIAERFAAGRLDPAGGTYGIYFDRHNRVIGYADELNRRTWVQSDGRGRVTKYIYPLLDEERLVYDDRNNVTQLTKVAKPCTPTPCTTPQLVLQADWNTTWNKLNWIRDAKSNQTDFVYYSSGNGKSLLQTATRPAPVGTTPRPVYTFTYNATGKVLDATDPTGLVLRSTYDPTNGNRLTTALDPAVTNAITSFGYDALGNLTSITDPRAFVTELAYDKIRRPTVTKHHNGNIAAAVIAAERSNYDALGRVTSEEAGTAFSGTTVTAWQARRSTTYTDTSQVFTVANGAGNTTTYSYDPMDRVQQIADPLNRRTRFEYDLAGQKLKEIRAYGSALQQDYATFTYTLNGLQQTIKDANNNLSTLEYDGFDRVSRLRFPVATAGANSSSTTDDELYGYDNNGNRTSLTKRDNQVIGYQYDNLDRLKVKDIPGGTAADVYTDYDLAGRLLYARFVSAAGSGIDYGYDTAKRLTSETSFGRAMTFGYDAASNRNRVTWPDTNFISYSFDALNRMTEVRENSATVGTGVLATYAYDSFSRRDFITRANGANSDYGYDNASRLTVLGHEFSGTSQDLSLGFGYTLASQLQTRATSNAIFEWTTVLPNRSYAVNGRNQYTTVSGTTYTHDPNGNLTSDGSRTFAYDVENRLTSVSGGASLTLSYDPSGRLRQTVGTATTQFLYDGDRLVAEYNGSGALLRRYVHGPATDDPLLWYEGSGLSDRRALHADERGSIVATSTSAASATTYTYGPYGEPATWSGSRFRYTGQIALPEAQLYFYKARVYDPLLGRLLQTDPIGYGDDLNLYAYVYNDPLNRVDPTGNFSLVEVGIVAAVGVIIAGCVASPSCGGGLAHPAGPSTRGVPGRQMAPPDALRSPFSTPLMDLVKGLVTGIQGIVTPSESTVSPADSNTATPTSMSSESGSYTNKHESGKAYHGKGGRERSQQSGREKAGEHADPHVATDWTPADSDRQAFKDEDARIQQGGGVASDDNYNKINSPGRKYTEQDKLRDP